MEPVTYVPAIAIDGKGLFLKRIQDDQRYEFFRKLIGSVVVRAIRRDNGQPIGVIVSTNQVIGRGLRCGVRAIRRVGRRFLERRVIFSEASVNFVGRHVDEPTLAVLSPFGSRHFQQRECPIHIRCNEGLGAEYRSIDVRLGREVDQEVDVLFFKQFFN